MKHTIKIGTRDSQLAVWQATHVQKLLQQNSVDSELVFIKSEGDIDTITPLYEIGVQGIFTKALDAALLNKRIDVAVHSYKDIPIQPAKGICLAGVLKRASYKDIFVYKNDCAFLEDRDSVAVIATSSIRRIAQWQHHYPNHTFENLRGNVNARLRKIQEHNWNGAIFAAAGLERINLRPANSVDLDWMLPAPAQGAIAVVCREEDKNNCDVLHVLNDYTTALCTKTERDFLKGLMGGCSMPISALAEIKNDTLIFKAGICSPDGKKNFIIEKTAPVDHTDNLGIQAADEVLKNEEIVSLLNSIKNAKAYH